LEKRLSTVKNFFHTFGPGVGLLSLFKTMICEKEELSAVPSGDFLEI
jgi:hypothetical protein